MRAVAVEVKTTNGHTDLCFADGKPDKPRQAGGVAVIGEFALYSTDAEGLRQASLTGGTALHAPDVALMPAARERTAVVSKVDYGEKKLWLDKAWQTPSLKGRVMEIGTAGAAGAPGHWTTYTIEKSQAEGARTTLIVQSGADYYRSHVEEVEPEKGLVWCGIAKAGTSGLNAGWVATNDDATKAWRATYQGGKRGDTRYGFELTGGPVRLEDFGEARAMRLWEYGVGDTVRQSTFASLRRLAPGLYELTADTDLAVALKAASLELSTDQAAWRKLTVRQAGGLAECRLTVQDFGPSGKVYLRVK